MEYHLTIQKNNGVLTHATIRINVENLIISERNESQKNTYFIILFI